MYSRHSSKCVRYTYILCLMTHCLVIVDGPVADTLNTLGEYFSLWGSILLTRRAYSAFLTIKMFMKLGPVIIYTPVFIIPSILFFIAGSSLGNIYLKAQLPVKREMSNAKAPVLAILGSTLSGLGKSWTASYINVDHDAEWPSRSLNPSVWCPRCV